MPVGLTWSEGLSECGYCGPQGMSRLDWQDSVTHCVEDELQGAAWGRGQL